MAIPKLELYVSSAYATDRQYLWRIPELESGVYFNLQKGTDGQQSCLRLDALKSKLLTELRNGD